MDTHLNYNKLIGFIQYIYNGGNKMKKLILVFIFTCTCLTAAFAYLVFSGPILEEKIEDLLESKYGYISDDSKYLELDFDVHKQGKNVYVNVKVDDDFYIAKTEFNKSIFDNCIKQVEETVKSNSKGKNVVINSYF